MPDPESNLASLMRDCWKHAAGPRATKQVLLTLPLHSPEDEFNSAGIPFLGSCSLPPFHGWGPSDSRETLLAKDPKDRPNFDQIVLRLRTSGGQRPLALSHPIRNGRLSQSLVPFHPQL